MARRMRIGGGTVAIYETSGADGNDPFTNPRANLSKVKVHTGLNYLQVAREVTKTITHPAVAGGQTWDWTTFSVNFKPEAYTADYLLDTHNLGYVPLCIIAQGDYVVEPGMPVQTNAGGGARYLDIYLTTTEVRVKERVDSGTSNLAAVTRTYRILLLKKAAPVAGRPTFRAETGRVRAGQDLFDTANHYLRQKAGGETPYTMGISQMIDTDGGVCKFLDAGGNATYDFFSNGDYGGSLSTVTAREVSR